MRRLFLILAVLSISGSSQQPAQQQPQTLPPVVKVEVPPTNPPSLWTQVYVAVPAFIGALSAWIGILVTIYNNRKQWDRQMTLTARQKHYETVLKAIQKEGRLYDTCWNALRTSNSVNSETLEAINTTQQEGLNAMAVAALYMSDTLFGVHSQLTTASAHLRNAITPPYNSAAADKCFGEYSMLFASFINTARADLGYKEKLAIINRYAAGTIPNETSTGCGEIE